MIGGARWFEHDDSTERGHLFRGDHIVVLSFPFTAGTHSTWFAFVLYNTTVGYIRLVDWVDEIVS